MEMTTGLLPILLTLAISYGLGCISTSYLIALKICGKDIRTMGSGNAGTTNVLRNLGKKAGAMTFAGDVFKGVSAIIIAIIIGKITGYNIEILNFIAIIGVVIGHNWPIHMGFRGGKGVATSLGAMLAISPKIALLSLGIFIIIVIFTRYISLGSIVSILFSPVIAIYLHSERLIIYACTFLAISVVITHRGNIVRLVQGKERKFGQKSME